MHRRRPKKDQSNERKFFGVSVLQCGLSISRPLQEKQIGPCFFQFSLRAQRRATRRRRSRSGQWFRQRWYWLYRERRRSPRDLRQQASPNQLVVTAPR